VNDYAPESVAGGWAGKERPEIQQAPGAVPAQTHWRRLCIRAGGLIFDVGNTGDAGEFGGEATSIRVALTVP